MCEPCPDPVVFGHRWDCSRGLGSRTPPPIHRPTAAMDQYIDRSIITAIAVQEIERRPIMRDNRPWHIRLEEAATRMGGIPWTG